MAPNADLRSKKESVLLVTKTFLNLGNGLDSFGFPFGKVEKSQITLVGFQGVKPRALLVGRVSHPSLYK